MADNDELLPNLFPDNPVFQAAWDRNRNQTPSVSADEIARARADADSAFENLSVAPRTPISRTIAAAIGASLPALFGGISGGWEGAGQAGTGMVSAMRNFQAQEENNLQREQQASRLGYEKKQRSYETLLSLAQREREQRDQMTNELLMKAGEDISENKRAKDRADEARALERLRFENDKELEDIKTANKGSVTQEMADSLKAQAEKLGLKIEVAAGEPIEVGKVVLDQLELRRKELADEAIATDREADNSRETLKALMGDENKEADRANKLDQISARGVQTRMTLGTKKELAKMGAVARATVGRIMDGEDPTPEDLAQITDPNDMKIVMNAWKNKQQATQGNRRLDIQDKNVTGNLADKAVGRQLQARDLGLKEANAAWSQEFKAKQFEAQRSYQNAQLGLQKQRVLAQQNAQLLKTRQFEAQMATPEAIAAEKTSLASIGATPEQLATLESEHTQQGLKLASGEIRRQLQYQKQATASIPKRLPAKAVEAYAAANNVQDILDNAYKVIKVLEKDSLGNPYATYTAQSIERLIPVSDAARAKSWLTMDGMRLLYTLSGKQINETEAKLFTDFFAGSAPMAIGDLRARFDDIARNSFTTALSHLDASAILPETRSSAKILAKRLVQRTPPKTARELVALRPDLFTEGDE